MEDRVFQSDLLVKIPNGSGDKVTLPLNAQGDIQVVNGQGKLSVQLIRNLINDNSLVTTLINSPVSIRNAKILFNLILRNFKQGQVETVNQVDPSFSGYAFYRLNIGTASTYTKISTDFVTHKFTDVGLTNGVEYKYAVTKAYSGIFETGFGEKISVTPQASASKQDFIIGDDMVALPGDKQIDFYVVYSPKFKGSEILDDIVSLDITQDNADPRKIVVNVVLRDFNGNQTSVSATRSNPSV
jgi:hypothetical protein